MTQSQFYGGLGKEEREEWRRMPTTQEAFRFIREQLESATNGAVLAAGGSELSKANVAYGRVAALSELLALLEKER